MSPDLPGRLTRISQELGREVKPEQLMKEVPGNLGGRQLPEDMLFDYCLAQESIQSVLREFGADRSTLAAVYGVLRAAGAGQWACGHWVAASALAYPHTLRYLLGYLQDGKSHRELAYRLVMHFERGNPLSG